MKLIVGLLLLISVVTAIDLRRKNGRHGRRRHRDEKLRKDEWEEASGKDYGGYTLHKTCRRSGMVALTFDDGVVPETSQILDILEKYGVRATFFVVGYTIEQYPMYRKVLHRMLDAGHTIGSHTFSHADLTQLGAAGIENELESAGHVIKSATGEKPRLLRPPFGYVSSEVMSVTGKLGYEIVNWNLDTNDWRSDYDTSPIMDSLYAADAGSSDSKIVLMHDRPITVKALESVIKFYKQKGYEFVNMERCLGVKGYF